MLRLGGRERAEIVLAQEQVGRDRQTLLVDRTLVPPGTPLLERRPLRAAPDAIAVTTRSRRVPRIEIGCGLTRREDRDVVRQGRVERLSDARLRGASFDVAGPRVGAV